MVGNVLKPESTVRPDTPIATGDEALDNPDSLPQEYSPQVEIPEVCIPVIFVSDLTLTVTTAFVPETTRFDIK